MDAAAFDPDRGWRLHPQVAVRPESFGALLYHFGTRKLSFLKNTTILTVVNSLEDHPDARSALRAAGIDDASAGALSARARRARFVQHAGPQGDAMTPSTSMMQPVPRLVDQFERGLDAPICLTWELTYACNLSCVHCLSSSGKRDPRELSTRQCMDIIDELERMQVFYVNIGGGEPTVRPDFWELVDYATAHHVGVKFSTNGVRITPEVAAKLAASDYVDVQISLDGATAEVNDEVRGPGSFAMADPRAGESRGSGIQGRQDLRRRHPAQRRPTRPLQGAGRPVRSHAPHHPAAPVRAGCRRLGRTAPDLRSAGPALRLAGCAR